MILEVIHYYNLGKQAAEAAVVHAIPGAYHMAFSMITSGEPNQMVAALLAVLGVSYIIIGGLWKTIAKLLSRLILY